MSNYCNNVDHTRFHGVFFTKNGCLACELETTTVVAREAYQILGKVVPEDQDDMIQWAVKSQDAVYTNAGAAYRTLGELFSEQQTCKHQWVDARNEIVQSGKMCPKCGAVRA